MHILTLMNSATTNTVKLSNGRSEVWFTTYEQTGKVEVTRGIVKRPIGRRAAMNQIAKLLSPKGGYKVVSAT